MQGIKDSVKSVSQYVNVNLSSSRNGRSFTIPLVNNIGLPNFASDKSWFVDFLKALKFSPDAAFIDIGANVGQCIIAFRSCYENQTYYGFEPSPHCAFYISKLVKANKLRNINLFPIGLSGSSGIMKFYAKDEAEQAATMVDDLRPGHYNSNDVSYIPVFPFDEIRPAEITEIGLIKIDVEGAELYVLNGLVETIKKFNPVIACEVLDCHSAETNLETHQERANAIVALMKSLGYRIFRIRLTGKLDFDEIQEIKLKQYTPESHLQNDYLFLPAGKEIADCISV